MKSAVLVLALIAIPALAQDKDGDSIVSVPKKYVSAEGLTHETETNAWIGIGREIGIATREGLNAVIDSAERFGTTKVGTFVMVMIAWKIMAKDVLGVVLGIPILIGGICLWMWIMKRVFFGYRVLARKEGHTKFYEDHPPVKFSSNEAKSAAGTCAAIALCGFIITALSIIF